MPNNAYESFTLNRRVQKNSRQICMNHSFIHKSVAITLCYSYSRMSQIKEFEKFLWEKGGFNNKPQKMATSGGRHTEGGGGSCPAGHR